MLLTTRNGTSVLAHTNCSHVIKTNISRYNNVTQSCSKIYASAGNRTRAVRVAGEHSTNEQLCRKNSSMISIFLPVDSPKETQDEITNK